MNEDYVETPEDTPAGYQGPAYGPFKCGNCHFFNERNSMCSKPQVIEELGNGKVDKNGCCNFFEKVEKKEESLSPELENFKRSFEK